jgi:hypothetical protein
MVESNFFILEEFITPKEEQACLDFVAPALARRRYQGSQALLYAISRINPISIVRIIIVCMCLFV